MPGREGIRVSLCSGVPISLSIKYAKNGFSISIHQNSVALRSTELCGVGTHFPGLQKLAAMVLDRVIRILQGVAGKKEHHRGVALDPARSLELLEAGQGHRGGRLAADAFKTDLRLGQSNLGFRHLLAKAAAQLQNPERLAPGGRIADLDRAGTCSGRHRPQHRVPV